MRAGVERWQFAFIRIEPFGRGRQPFLGRIWVPVDSERVNGLWTDVTIIGVYYTQADCANWLGELWRHEGFYSSALNILHSEAIG